MGCLPTPSSSRPEVEALTGSGLRLYEWSTTALQSSMPINIARKEFIKLSMDLRSECNFIVMEDTDAVRLERSEAIDGVALNRPVPARRVWYETATGKAIVAFQSRPRLNKSWTARPNAKTCTTGTPLKC
jgi:DNA-binding IclR family transcriptional regulator